MKSQNNESAYAQKRKLPFENTSGEIVPPNAVMKVHLYDSSKDGSVILQIIKPDGEAAPHVVNGPTQVAVGGYGTCSADWPLIAMCETLGPVTTGAGWSMVSGQGMFAVGPLDGGKADVFDVCVVQEAEAAPLGDPPVAIGSIDETVPGDVTLDASSSTADGGQSIIYDQWMLRLPSSRVLIFAGSYGQPPSFVYDSAATLDLSDVGVATSGNIETLTLDESLCAIATPYDDVQLTVQQTDTQSDTLRPVGSGGGGGGFVPATSRSLIGTQGPVREPGIWS